MNYTNRISDIDKRKQTSGLPAVFNETVLFKIKEYFRTSFVYSSASFNGNTLTEYETRAVIKELAKISGHEEREINEAKGISNAYGYIFKLLKKPLEAQDILELHKLLYNNAEYSGKYRDKNIIIAETRYNPPEYGRISDLADEFINLMPRMEEILHPVRFASWLHLNFLNIYPFNEGNYECASLVSSIALLKAGYPPLIIPHTLKRDYFEALKQAQSEKEPDMLSAFISEILFETMRELAAAWGKTIK